MHSAGAAGDSSSRASRVILRDGTVARPCASTGRDDRDALRRFFHELSPESRRRRFFSLAEPPDALIDAFCDSAIQRGS